MPRNLHASVSVIDNLTQQFVELLPAVKKTHSEFKEILGFKFKVMPLQTNVPEGSILMVVDGEPTWVNADFSGKTDT